MAIVYWSYRGNDEQFQVERILDAIGAMWHCLDGSPPLPQDRYDHFKRLWRIEMESCEGFFGVFDPHLDDWFENDSEALEFLSILRQGVMTLDAQGEFLSISILKKASPDPSRLISDPPTIAYIESLKKLINLIEKGVESKKSADGF